MDELEGAVAAESPTADVSPDTAAGPHNTEPQPQQPPTERQVPFHQHPRFQQVIGQNRELRQTVQQLQKTVEDLQRTAQQPARTADEREQRSAAIKVLKELMTEDPEMAELLKLREELPHLRQGYQGIEQVSLAQQRAAMSQARSHISQLADEAGLPKDEKFRHRLVRMVALETKSLPEGNERFERGDYSVLTDAFQAVQKEFLGGVKREAATGVLTTKNALKRLPPANTRGAAPGREAPPKLEPGKEREFREGLHTRAARLLESLQG